MIRRPGLYARSARLRSALNAAILGMVSWSLAKRQWASSLEAGQRKMQAMYLFARCAARESKRTKAATTWHASSANMNSAGHAELARLMQRDILRLAEAAASKWWMKISNQETTCAYRKKKKRIAANHAGVVGHAQGFALPLNSSHCSSSSRSLHSSGSSTNS